MCIDGQNTLPDFSHVATSSFLISTFHVAQIDHEDTSFIIIPCCFCVSMCCCFFLPSETWIEITAHRKGNQISKQNIKQLYITLL